MREDLVMSTATGPKFWQVETLGAEALTWWGKTGTFGKVKITEHPDAEICAKAASRLASSKRAKGYSPAANPFDESLWYFDDPDFGVHRLTSHPRFVAWFPEDLFYDQTSEFSPFGSDTGADTFSELECRVLT